MTTQERVFAYKLDFYYLSALLYLVTLVLYGGIRGNFVEAKFEYVLNDPILYVIILFVLISFVSLALNALRRRRLVLTGDAIVFANRFEERRIPVTAIEWMHIGRERGVQTGGRFQVVVFKVKGRRRLVRIRVGRYERDRELVAEMQAIAAAVPPRRGGWRRSRFTDR